MDFEEARHLYTRSIDGSEFRKVDGVTSANGVINKPALLYWAVGLAIEHMEKNWKPGVAYDEIQIQEILKDAKGAHRKFSSKAADTGTMVHKWIEEYIRTVLAGDPQPELPVNELIKKSIEQFLSWVEKNKVKFILSEEVVYSLKHDYAGKLDGTIEMEGVMPRLNLDGSREYVEVAGLYIDDVKTSSGVYPEMSFQQSAYLAARVEEFPEESYNGRIVIRIGKDGVFDPVLLQNNVTLDGKVIDIQEMDERAFLGALDIFKRLEFQKTLERMLRNN